MYMYAGKVRSAINWTKRTVSVCLHVQPQSRLYNMRVMKSHVVKYRRLNFFNIEGTYSMTANMVSKHQADGATLAVCFGRFGRIKYVWEK